VTQEDRGQAQSPASLATFFAEVRTMLAWWRTGLAVTGVAVAIGGIIPHVAGLPRTRFLLLSAGYGLLAIVLVVIAAVKYDRFRQGGGVTFSRIRRAVVIVISGYLSLLIALTVAALF
jgi:uncharacterized membrane protein YidH (DUF202 family)